MRLLPWTTCFATCFVLGTSAQNATQPAETQPAPVGARPETGFLYKTITVDGRSYAYCVYVPPEYTADRPWPVILFLHGSGERGADGFRQTDVGIARAIRRHRRLCPAIVVMPQCHPGKWWEGDMLDLALRCVEDASAQYHCDPDRVYLTGLSMGGAGAWQLGSRMPDAFAALAPICGFYERPDRVPPQAGVDALASRLTGLPIWCFHGALDTNVPVQRSRELVAAVRRAGGKVTYTEIPEGRHHVWDRVYDNPELWRWLFAQQRSPHAEQTP